MKKYFTLIIMALPLMCSAETVTDTTFTYNDKKIVVTETGNDTKVAVENQQGEKFHKLSETTFVDGKEVTQVYVTSPFLPDKWSTKRRRTFVSHTPWISIGFSTLAGSPMGLTSDDALQQHSSLSWDLALSAFSVAVPFNSLRTFGISTGLTLGWIKHRFNDNYTLVNNDGTVSVQPIELADGERMKRSYLSYTAMRVPINFEYQHNIHNNEFFVTLGVSLEWRSQEHSRYKTNKHTITPAKDININPFGLNFEAQMGYSGFAVFMRSALTPLMKTNRSPKAYTTTIGLALSL